LYKKLSGAKVAYNLYFRRIFLVKKFLAGIIFGLSVSFCVVAFASQTPQNVSQVIAKKIDAYFGRVKLVVNGKNVDKETLVYDDSTYIPLRAAAEVLGVEVEWDEKTGTAILTSPNVGPTATGSSGATPSSSSSASATGSSSTKTTSTVVSTSSASSTTVPTTSGTTGTSTAAPTASGTSGTSATATGTTSVSTTGN
jgi:hypothetical protein